jgi:hypothetical protein
MGSVPQKTLYSLAPLIILQRFDVKAIRKNIGRLNRAKRRIKREVLGDRKISYSSRISLYVSNLYILEVR